MKENQLRIRRGASFIKSFLLVSLMFSTSALLAETHIIGVSNYEFDPATVTATVGDTIIWQWDGGKHTTTSSKIPDGAATWDAELKSSVKTYAYVVTIPGEYDYVCTPHTDMGMTGTINVVQGKSKQEPSDKDTKGQGFNDTDHESHFSGQIISKDPNSPFECLLYSEFYIKQTH